MKELESELDNFISAAVLRLVNPTKYPQLEQFIPNILEHMLNSDINPAWDADVIEEYISRYVARIAEMTNEELMTQFENILDNGDATGVGEPSAIGSGIKDFDEQLATAFDLLERLQTLRESIAELEESGILTGSIVDAIIEAFGVDGENVWQEIINNATDEIDGLDFDGLMEALKEKLAEQEVDADALLAFFGLNEDSEAAVRAAMEKLAEAADVDKLAEIWATIPEKTKEAMGDAGKEIEILLAYTADEAEDAATKVENALKRIERAAQMDELVESGNVWSDLKDIVEDLTGSTAEAANALSDINDKITEAGTAAGALEAAARGDSEAIEYLANLTGLTAEQLANNLAPAEMFVSEMGDQATMSIEYLANMLMTLNAIDLDASGKIVPIQNLEAAADACGLTVAALANVVAMFNGSSITWSKTADGLGLRARAVVPKITWSGISSGTSKKSGGRGG